MIDPISLTVNVASITQICVQTIQAINQLITNYKNAPRTIYALHAESKLVSASLSQLRSLFEDNGPLAARLDSKPDLRAALDSTLTGCWALYSLLDKDLKRVQENDEKKLTWQKKGYFLFTEQIIQGYLQQIRGQQTGLSLLLNCLQTHSVTEIQNILIKYDNILVRIARDSKHLRKEHADLDVPESIYEGSTIVDNEDKEFPFDDEVVDSKAYRKAMKSARRNSELNQVSAGNASLNLSPRQQSMVAGPSSEYDIMPRSQGSGDILAQIPETLRPRNAERQFESSASQSSRSIPRGDEPEGDLIDLSDAGPSNWQTPQQFSPSLCDLQALDSNGSTSYFREDSAPKMLADEDMMRDMTSTGPTQRPVSSVPSVSLEQDKFVVVPDNFDRRSSTRSSVQHSIGRSSIVASILEVAVAESGSSMANLGISIPQDPSSNGICTSPSELPTPVSPEVTISPFPELHHRTEEVPMSDDETAELLTSFVGGIDADCNTDLQLNWAEDSLRFIDMCAKHEERAAKSERSRANITNLHRTLGPEAAGVVEALAEKGNARAIFLKARYPDQFGADPSRVQDFLFKASFKGHVRAAFYIGKLYEEQGSYNDAFVRYKEGADLGDSACQYRLSKAYFNGTLDQKKDEKKATAYLMQAALRDDKDFPEPIYHLATLQAKPLKKFGVFKGSMPQDDAGARANLQRAARLGHSTAQLRVGIVHLRGGEPQLGLLRDEALGLHYLRLAARRGVPEADYAIARWMALHPDGIHKGHEKMAYAHVRRAAEDGWVPAFGLLGIFYEEGLGTRKDPITAKTWYLKGVAEKDQFAETRLERMRSVRVVGFVRSN